MSGGHFNYCNEQLTDRLFPSCMQGTPNEIMLARRDDPMHNKLVSELTYDVLSLIRKLDLYESGDIMSDTYTKAVQDFMKAWLFTPTNKTLIKREIENAISETKQQLFQCFGIEDKNL